jgi:glutaredoxin
MPNAMITLVHAPACHFCADAQKALAELGQQFPITVELVEAESPVGAALIEEHRPALFPLVLLDGEFFSTGRLPRRKLRAVLAQHAVGSAT